MSTAATKDEITAQRHLIETLHALEDAEQREAAIKKATQGNARHASNDASLAESSRAMMQQMAADRRAEEDAERDQEKAHEEAVTRLVFGERLKIEATKNGTAARVAALDAAMREEEKFGLQETATYRGFALERVQTIRQMAEEEARIRAEAGREAAQHASKMGELQISAERETAKLLNSGRRMSEQELLDQERNFTREEFNIQLAAIHAEMAALDKGGKEYEAKILALHNREEELRRAHENKLTEMTDRATIERNARILAAEQRMKGEIARDLTSVLMQHQSFASMMANVGDQVATGLMESALKYALTLDANKRHEAAAAARQGWLTGQKFPFPVNIAMAPILAASAFETVMGFAAGGIVPGVGNGDTVPAMLTPGEHVADRQLTEGLRNMVRDGGGRKTTHVHVHVHNTYHLSALDTGGMEGVLERHNDAITSHVERVVRRMNQ